MGVSGVHEEKEQSCAESQGPGCKQGNDTALSPPLNPGAAWEGIKGREKRLLCGTPK